MVKTYRIAVTTMAFTLLLASSTAQAEGGTPPSPPQEFQAVGTAAGTELRWLDPVFDGGSAVESFRVFRDGGLLAEVQGHSFVDPFGGSASVYLVAAVNAEGQGAPSAAMVQGSCLDWDPSNFPIPVSIDPVACLGQVQDDAEPMTGRRVSIGISAWTPLGAI